MTQTSLTARWVLPIDGDPMEGALVTIDDGVIVAVAKRSAATGPVQDLGDVVLLPGLINAHTHLEFSHLSQPLGTPGMTLPDWIRLVISNRNRRDSSASIESFVSGELLGDRARQTEDPVARRYAGVGQEHREYVVARSAEDVELAQLVL